MPDETILEELEALRIKVEQMQRPEQKDEAQDTEQQDRYDDTERT